MAATFRLITKIFSDIITAYTKETSEYIALGIIPKNPINDAGPIAIRSKDHQDIVSLMAIWDKDKSYYVIHMDLCDKLLESVRAIYMTSEPIAIIILRSVKPQWNPQQIMDIFGLSQSYYLQEHLDITHDRWKMQYLVIRENP